jgi:hypothetical protein
LADQRRADGSGKLGVRVSVHRHAEVALQHRGERAQRLTPPVNSSGPLCEVDR